MTKLQRLGVNDLPSEAPSGAETDSSITTSCGAFSKVKMCSTIEELNAIAEDDVALRLQVIIHLIINIFNIGSF